MGVSKKVKLLWVVLGSKSLGGNVGGCGVVEPCFFGLLDVQGALFGAVVEDGLD